MVGERNRIVELVRYIESHGVEVNIGKNKAGGNKGIFRANKQNFRIDIAKGQSDNVVLQTLVHEFAHFIHYLYDKSLNSTDFIVNCDEDSITEELLNLTVHSIPKTSVEPIFAKKESLKTEIKSILSELLKKYPDIKLTEPYYPLEQKIKKTDLSYLLKYDRVKLIKGFSAKIYSWENIDADIEIKQYLKLKSLQRAQKRINSRINRLNKYYNSPTELFARAVEIYFTDKDLFSQKAPNLFKCFENSEIKEFNELKSILS